MHNEAPATKYLWQGRSALLLEQSARKLSSDKQQMPYMAWVRWRSRCNRSKKAHTIALEQSVRKLSEDKQQSTLFTSLDILWWFHTRAVLCSLANTSVSLRKVKKKGMNPVQSNRRSQKKPSAKSRKRENAMVVRLLPGSHERLASRNPRVLFQKHGGACTIY